MADGLTISYSGAVAQSEALDAAANNLANAATAGFRAQRPVFAQVLASAGPDGRSPRGVHVVRLRLDLTQGPVRTTGNPLDVALRGPGFLAISTPAGERYTRDGGLALSRDGTLVTAAGQPVLGEGGPIRIDAPGAVGIAADGTISVGPTVVGRLKLVEFADPRALEPEGHGLLRATSAGAARPAASTGVMQGHLEQSNVNVVRGLTDLVRISRAHDAFHRTIQTLREIDQRAANDVAARR
jgi:flagellar basal-body rod protein FlgF